MRDVTIDVQYLYHCMEGCTYCTMREIKARMGDLGAGLVVIVAKTSSDSFQSLAVRPVVHIS